MMWISSVLLLVAFSSALPQRKHLYEQYKQCSRGIEELDLEKLQKKSGEVQMDTVCTAFLEAFHCADGIFSREFESTFEEMADLIVGMDIDEEVKQVLRFAVNTKSMLTDLCTEGTQLNRDVKKDLQCFGSIDRKDAAIECIAKAAVYKAFTNISNEIEADSCFKKDCQEIAFMSACISYLVHEKCGQRAFNTFNTIIKRTTIFPNRICSKEKLEEMKISVIARLNMPEENKNLFKQALKRRRKLK